nr:hypothetical protein [Candidatus Sigynarchaeum springense]
MGPDEQLDYERERRENLAREIARQREIALQQHIPPQLPSTGDAQYDFLIREIARMQKCIDDLCKDVKSLKMKNERRWV